MSLVENRKIKLVDRLSERLASSTEFLIASAYISPGACERLSLLSYAKKIPVRIALGRAHAEGLPSTTKNYLRSLHMVAAEKGGGVRVAIGAGFHSKIYCGSEAAFAGSSNLTDHGLESWREATWEFADPSAVGALRSEAGSLYDSGVDFDEVFDQIRVAEVRTIRASQGDSSIVLPTDPGSGTPGIKISLLSKGEVPPKSGLNWGHAAGRVRDLNECYIRLPKLVLAAGAYVFGSSERGTIVNALAHDGARFELRLQGKSTGQLAKQISTYGDNSTLGRWIRSCLGVPAEHLITRSDLDAYGRTTISFFRIGTELDGRPIVYMDFSV